MVRRQLVELVLNVCISSIFVSTILQTCRNIGIEQPVSRKEFDQLIVPLYNVNTRADFIYKVLGVYTHSTETIYLSPSAKVAVGTFIMKCPVSIYLYVHNQLTRTLFVGRAAYKVYEKYSTKIKLFYSWYKDLRRKKILFESFSM